MIRILLLDDVDATCRHIKQEISDEKRDITIFTTIEAVLDALDRGSYDFLITDLRLNNINIFEQVAEIRKRYPLMKIVVISGYKVSPEDITSAGIDYFFGKPVDIQALEMALAPPDYSAEALETLVRKIKDRAVDGFHQILENINAGISILDLNRNVLYANKKQKKISGDIRIGEACFKSFAPHAISYCSNCPIAVAENAVTTHVRSAGYYDIQCVHLKDRNDKLFAYAKICQEVTDRERLLDIKEKILGTMPLKERCHAILCAMRTMNFSNANMFIVSDDGRFITHYASLGPTGYKLVGKSQPLEKDKFALRTFGERKPIIVRKDEYTDACSWHDYSNSLKCWGAIPIMKDEKPLGVITVDNYDENYPDMTLDRIRSIDENAMQELCRMSEIMKEAILSESEIRKLEISKRLSFLEEKIVSDKTTDEILATVLKGCVEVARFYWKYLYDTEEEDFFISGNMLRKTGQWAGIILGENEKYNRHNMTPDLSLERNTPWVKAANTGQREAVVIHDTSADQEWKRLIDGYKGIKTDSARITADYFECIRSMGCFPIHSKDELIGVMTIESSKPDVINDYLKTAISKFISSCCLQISYSDLLEYQNRQSARMIGFGESDSVLMRIKDKQDFIWAMLTILTHESGLKYNRAIYYKYLPGEGYIAEAAVGPLDKKAAEKTIKAIAEFPVPLDAAIRNARESNKELTSYVKDKKCAENVFHENIKIWNKESEYFKDIVEANEFMSMSVSLEEKKFGGIVLDNFYSGNRFTEQDKGILNTTRHIFSILLNNIHMDVRRYFDPTVFDAIEHNPDLLKIQSKTITIVFWDIRSFSKLCDNLKEHTHLISGFLREYFDAGTTFIRQNNGILDKFIGDGIMALFGPISERDDKMAAVDSVNAALDLRNEFERIKDRWVKQWSYHTPAHVDIKLGCGIHTGPVLVGNINTVTRDQYTALGPHVNLAQRIENEAKSGEILLSQTTLARVDDHFATRKVKKMKNIKNIAGEYNIFEVTHKK